MKEAGKGGRKREEEGQGNGWESGERWQDKVRRRLGAENGNTVFEINMLNFSQRVEHFIKRAQ